jgi:hypothetical protein
MSTMTTGHRLLLAVWLAIAAPPASGAAPATDAILTGTVPAELPAGEPVPVVLPIPDRLAKAPLLKGFVQVAGSQAASIPIQVEPADPIGGTPARGWFMWTSKAGQAGKIILVALTPAADADARPAYRIEPGDPLVQVVGQDRKPVLTYRHGAADPAFKYPLTSYIHPLVGLDGEVLTDCSPKDHPHHRGLFWAWVRLEKNGQSVGEWWIPRDTTLAGKRLETGCGPVFARFAAEHTWDYAIAPASQPVGGLKRGDSLVSEQVVCRVFETTAGGRAIDLDLTLTALTDGLRLGGQTQLNKGYGGATLRFATDKAQQGRAEQPRIVADGQLITKDLNHLKARWVDWTGVFKGPDGRPLDHRSGGAMFVHPSHPPLPAEPPEWITRAYGPINPAYPGLDMLALPRDRPLRLRYRIWLHRHDAGPAGVAAQYSAYAADWRWRGDASFQTR